MLAKMWSWWFLASPVLGLTLVGGIFFLAQRTKLDRKWVCSGIQAINDGCSSYKGTKGYRNGDQPIIRTSARPPLLDPGVCGHDGKEQEIFTLMKLLESDDR